MGEKTLRELLIERQAITESRRAAEDIYEPADATARGIWAARVRCVEAEVVAGQELQVALVAAVEALQAYRRGADLAGKATASAIEALTERVAAMEADSEARDTLAVNSITTLADALDVPAPPAPGCLCADCGHLLELSEVAELCGRCGAIPGKVSKRFAADVCGLRPSQWEPREVVP